MGNITNITDVTNLQSLEGAATFVQTGTAGLFFVFLLIGIWIIFTLNMRRNGTENAIIVSSFATLMISLFMVYLNWINFSISIIFAVLTVAGILIKINRNE